MKQNTTSHSNPAIVDQLLATADQVDQLVTLKDQQDKNYQAAMARLAEVEHAAQQAFNALSNAPVDLTWPIATIEQRMAAMAELQRIGMKSQIANNPNGLPVPSNQGIITPTQAEADRKKYREELLIELITLCESLADGWGDPAEESGMYRVKQALEELL